jgi:hypothetical protein
MRKTNAGEAGRILEIKQRKTFPIWSVFLFTLIIAYSITAIRLQPHCHVFWAIRE